MKKVFIIKKLQNSIESGSFFKIVYSVILKVIAILFGLVSIFTIIRSWKLSKYLDTSGYIGLILAEIFLVLGVFCIIYIIWSRSDELIQINKTDHNILYIVAHLFKMIGEISLIFFNVSGISSAISIWFAVGYLNEGLNKLVSKVPLAAFLKYISGSGIGFGFLLILFNFFYSLFVLMLFYFWADVILGFSSIVKNSESIKYRNKKQ